MIFGPVTDGREENDCENREADGSGVQAGSLSESYSFSSDDE